MLPAFDQWTGREEREEEDAAICRSASSVQSIAGERGNTIYGLTIEEICLTASQSRFAAISTFEHIASPPPHFPHTEGMMEINTWRQEKSRNKRKMKQPTMSTGHAFI